MIDCDSYQEVQEDPTEASMKKVKRFVIKMYKEGAISDHMKKYLVPKHP